MSSVHTVQTSTVCGSSETPPPTSTCCSSSSNRRSVSFPKMDSFEVSHCLQTHCLSTQSTQTLAEQFYNTYNGCWYNSLEKTICQIVYVSRLEILRSSKGAALAPPGLTELPSCPVCLERLVGGYTTTYIATITIKGNVLMLASFPVMLPAGLCNTKYSHGGVPTLVASMREKELIVQRNSEQLD